MSGRGSLFFYRVEEGQCPVFCITRSKGGRFHYSFPLLGVGQEVQARSVTGPY